MVVIIIIIDIIIIDMVFIMVTHVSGLSSLMGAMYYLYHVSISLWIIIIMNYHHRSLSLWNYAVHYHGCQWSFFHCFPCHCSLVRWIHCSQLSISIIWPCEHRILGSIFLCKNLEVDKNSKKTEKIYGRTLNVKKIPPRSMISGI